MMSSSAGNGLSASSAIMLGSLPKSKMLQAVDLNDEGTYAIRYVNLLYRAKTIAYLEIELNYKNTTYRKKAHQGLIKRDRLERWGRYPKILRRVIKHELRNSNLITMHAGSTPPGWVLKYFAALTRMLHVPDEAFAQCIDRILNEPQIAEDFGGTSINPYDRARGFK